MAICCSAPVGRRPVVWHPQLGAGPVCAYHRYWSCPRLGSHADEAVRATQWMRRLFDTEYQRFECLWGRAILPASLVAQDPQLQPHDIEASSTPAFESSLGRQLQAYTDGSGGPRWVPKPASRVGSAVATVQVDTANEGLCITDVGLQIAPAPGRATVPRAELWAAILAVRGAPPGSTVALRIDAAYVVKGLRSSACREALAFGTNGDLWNLLLDTIQQRALQVEPHKVKADAEKQVLLGEVELQHFLGNVLADAGAGAAAENAVNNLVAQDVSQWEGRAFLIAKRLAAIEAGIWSSAPCLVPAPPPVQRVEPPDLPVAASAVQKAIERMGHRLHYRGAFVHCSRCRRHRGARTLRFWTRAPCRGRPAGHDEHHQEDADHGEPATAAVVSSAATQMPAQMVTPAKRRRLLSAQRVVLKEDAAKAWATTRTAWDALACALPRQVHESDAHHVQALFVEVHPTHDCIECGGYVGCTRCGSVVATARKCALSPRCRGSMPAGAAGPVARLAEGRLPRGDRWPNGELEPRPKRLRAV